MCGNNVTAVAVLKQQQSLACAGLLSVSHERDKCDSDIQGPNLQSGPRAHANEVLQSADRIRDFCAPCIHLFPMRAIPPCRARVNVLGDTKAAAPVSVG